MELHSKYCIIYTCILLLMLKRKYKVEYPIMTKKKEENKDYR